MITDNDPLITKYVSVPKEINTLSCAAFIAGIVEAVLDMSQFSARVTAHNMATPEFPHRTTILIKLNSQVIAREQYFS